MMTRIIMMLLMMMMTVLLSCSHCGGSGGSFGFGCLQDIPVLSSLRRWIGVVLCTCRHHPRIYNNKRRRSIYYLLFTNCLSTTTVPVFCWERGFCSCPQTANCKIYKTYNTPPTWWRTHYYFLVVVSTTLYHSTLLYSS
jgi:hypothetical protein